MADSIDIYTVPDDQSKENISERQKRMSPEAEIELTSQKQISDSADDEKDGFFGGNGVTSERTGIDISREENEVTSERTGTDTSREKNGVTSERTGSDNLREENGGTSERTGTDTSREKNGVTSERTGRDTSREKNGVTSERTGRDISREENGGTSERTGIDTSREENGGTSERTRHDSFRGKNGVTSERTGRDNTREENGGTSERTGHDSFRGEYIGTCAKMVSDPDADQTSALGANTTSKHYLTEGEQTRDMFWKYLAISIINGYRSLQDVKYMMRDLKKERDIGNPAWPNILNEFSTKSYKITNCAGVADVKEVKYGKGLTFLHLAVISLPDEEQGARLVEEIMKLEPQLIKSGFKHKSGPTPFHMAVAKGNVAIARTILEFYIDNRNELLGCEVGGAVLRTGTPMMGRLPLNIAALTLNEKIFDLLVECGASLTVVNSSRESVLHSLVSYVACHPGREAASAAMMKYIVEGHLQKANTRAWRPDDNKTVVHSLLRTENSKGETILRMSARLGLKKIFEYVIDIPMVYRTETLHYGVDGVSFYDVTEIDKQALTGSKQTIPVVVSVEDRIRQRGKCYKSFESFNSWCRSNKTQSVLELVCSLPLDRAVAMATVPVLAQVIDNYWSSYRWHYAVLALYHFVVMCLVTAATVDKEINVDKRFVAGINIFYFFLSLPYFIAEFLRVFVSKQPYSVTRLHHNGLIRLAFGLFAVCLFIHACWDRASPWDSYLAPPTLVLGWWTMTYFLRGFETFSYFTVLLPTIVVGDFVRFFVFLFTSVVAFSAAIMTAIPSSVGEFSNYGMTILTMMKLAVAPQDVSDHSANAERPASAVILLCLYLVSTYLILLNCLIGMFVYTISDLTKDTKGQLRLQRLSVSIFLEGMLLPKLKVRLKNELQEDGTGRHTSPHFGYKTPLIFKVVSASYKFGE